MKITYTPDAILKDRIAGVKKTINAAETPVASNIGYYPFGPMKAITYGNNLTGAMQYDTQYRAVDITIGAVMHYQYDLYDYNGNIKSIKNILDQTRNRSFTYDVLDRLDIATSAPSLWGTLDWDYDAVGNRTKENANNYIYPSNSNKLSEANSKSYLYDANGNTTVEGSRIFGYNDNQRLVSVSDAGVAYTYNGNGQRVKKNVNGTVTIFHYSLGGQIIAESNSAGTVTAEYVYLNGQPLAKLEGANTYYYHNDHLGTPLKLTDSTGTVVWSADYKPFGEATVTVSTTTNNLRFPGQYFDTETRLHYNYYRDYDPVVGRYAEADRVGLKGGINLYVYVRNRPINRIDLFGLMDIDPTGFYDSSSQGPMNGSLGIGVYFGGGFEVSYSGSNCCENNTAYHVEIMTVCGGAGVGIEGDLPVSIGVGGISSQTGCPRTRYYYKHETVLLFRSVNFQYDGAASAGISGGIYGISTSWAFCSDTVMSKRKIGCCIK